MPWSKRSCSSPLGTPTEVHNTVSKMYSNYLSPFLGTSHRWSEYASFVYFRFRQLRFRRDTRSIQNSESSPRVSLSGPCSCAFGTCKSVDDYIASAVRSSEQQPELDPSGIIVRCLYSRLPWKSNFLIFVDGGIFERPHALCYLFATKLSYGISGPSYLDAHAIDGAPSHRFYTPHHLSSPRSPRCT